MDIFSCKITDNDISECQGVDLYSPTVSFSTLKHQHGNT